MAYFGYGGQFALAVDTTLLMGWRGCVWLMAGGLKSRVLQGGRNWPTFELHFRGLRSMESFHWRISSVEGGAILTCSPIKLLSASLELDEVRLHDHLVIWRIYQVLDHVSTCQDKLVMNNYDGQTDLFALAHLPPSNDT